MPRRLIQSPEHKRSRALHIAVWWIETFTVHGPGDVQGEPSLLVDEFADFIVDCYALDGNGKRLYDSAFFSRPKGCDKSGLASKIVLFEALGPCRFAGWAKGGETYTFLGQTYTYRAGEAMGKGITVPYVRIMATEEGQTGNVYDTVYFNLTDEGAPLHLMRAYGCDPGLTRIGLPDGGEITPSTTGAASKDGGKETFVVFDETHLYVTPQLKQMYATVTRNLRKRKRIGTWFIETTTMYAPGQESKAEETYKLADLLAEKAQDPKKYRNLRSRLLFDHRWGEIEDLSDEDALRIAIEEAYGDALSWNDLDGIVDGIYDPREAENDSRRYFLNAIYGAANAWLQPAQIEAAQKRGSTATEGFVPLAPGDLITLGFDGSKNNDATALMGCRVSDRHVFPILIEELPDGPEAEGWAVDREAFDAAVHKAFQTYEVVGFYADPPHWQDYLDAWQKEFGEDLIVHATKAHSLEWWTNREFAIVNALERFHTALVVDLTASLAAGAGALELVTRRHFLNTRAYDKRAGKVIGKDRKGSAHKIDAVMAATLAFEAASDFAAKPRPKKRAPAVPMRVR